MKLLSQRNVNVKTGFKKPSYVLTRYTLSTDTYRCLEVHEKKAETVTALLDVWSESLGLELLELTFVTDREESFRNSLLMRGFM